ncbi:MAG: ribonuclease E/G [Tissierellia bacterium]|nr:ribonuclease E/G [Tissierellia bacterium]
MNYGFLDKYADISGIIIDGEIKSYIKYDKEKIPVGSIIRARINKKLDWIDSYEVQISQDQTAILPYKDKITEEKNQILVMLTKNALDNKSARVTEKLCLKGEFIILDFYGKGVFVSRKIKDNEIVKELKFLGKSFDSDSALIFRTSSEFADIQDIEKEYSSLALKKEIILNEINFLPTPKIIYWQKPDYAKPFLNYIDELDEIIVNSKRVFEDLNSHKILKDILVYDQDYRSEDDRKLQFQLGNMLTRKLMVHGAEIVIDELEALTFIDINSSSNKNGMNKITNAKIVNNIVLNEIAKQIMLRNIRGIVFIDFIRMGKKDGLDLISNIKKELDSFGIRYRYIGFTKSGIMEIILKV